MFSHDISLDLTALSTSLNTKHIPINQVFIINVIDRQINILKLSLNLFAFFRLIKKRFLNSVINMHTAFDLALSGTVSMSSRQKNFLLKETKIKYLDT